MIHNRAAALACVEAETDGGRGVSASAAISATFSLHTCPEKKKIQYSNPVYRYAVSHGRGLRLS